MTRVGWCGWCLRHRYFERIERAWRCMSCALVYSDWNINQPNMQQLPRPRKEDE